MKPPPGEGHHARVEVESVNGISAEQVENETGPDSTATTQLESPSAAHGPGHAQQATRLVMPLERRAHRVVHERELKAIQQQRRPSDCWPNKGLFNGVSI